jgi:hypothetical protein
MYVQPIRYDTVANFIGGYDTGLEGGLLVGFHEWLVVRIKGFNNLHWAAIVCYLTFPDEADPWNEVHKSPEFEQRAIDNLFSLIEEFLQLRKDSGLRRIFFDYEKWLKRQKWYGPSSPDYLK